MNGVVHLYTNRVTDGVAPAREWRGALYTNRVTDGVTLFPWNDPMALELETYKSTRPEPGSCNTGLDGRGTILNLNRTGRTSV